MIRGLYTSGWSMLAIQKKMDVITNNMANVSTDGYKKDILVLASFPDLLAKMINYEGKKSEGTYDVGGMRLGSDVGEVFTCFSQGQLNNTGNETDVAIRDSDNAFFTIAVPDGEGNFAAYYTRDGSFARSSENMLVTKEGYPVLGVNGPIYLNGGEFSVGADGTVTLDGKEAGKLLITEFTDTTVLRKHGNNLLRADEGAETREFTGTVQQGFLEMSNVNIIREMVDMITVLRSYEANQKVLQAMDGTLDKAVNQVGYVR